MDKIQLYYENNGENMLLTNNIRKMHNIPLIRKTNKRKRFYTRNKSNETINAFLNYCEYCKSYNDYLKNKRG